MHYFFTDYSGRAVDDHVSIDSAIDHAMADLTPSRLVAFTLLTTGQTQRRSAPK